jgi:DNA-binding NarL/FixJ family response regulator
MPMQTQGQRLLWCAEADRQLASNNAARALEILDALYAAALNLDEEGAVPLLAMRKAQALTMLGRSVEAEELLLRAIETTARMGAQPTRLRLLSVLAGIRMATGRSEEAVADVVTAQALIAKLAGTLPPGSLRDGFVAAATAALPGSRQSARRAAGAILTGREQEVAAHVAQGRTNRDIAAALFVSERTAEAHISNIMRKLGFTARTQIARWVAEQGITSSAT